MIKRTAFVSLITAFASQVNTASASMVDLRFVPAIQSVNMGDTFTVQVIADISSPVLGWGLDLILSNPSVALIAEPPLIGSQWLPISTPDGDGLGGIAFPNGIGGTGVLLATLSFTAVSLGVTDVQLYVTPGDFTEGFPLDPVGFASLNFETGQFTVVPEPSTIVLLAFGTALLVRRRK